MGVYDLIKKTGHRQDSFLIMIEKMKSKPNPQNWADKNVNIRWKFNDNQKELIYKLIEDIWE